MERQIRLEVVTPILAGHPKSYFSFRVFTKADFSTFRIVPWNFEISEEDIEEYAREHGIDKMDIIKNPRILKEIIDKKADAVEKDYVKLGFVKLDYLFPRRHFDIDKVITIKDYYNWIDWWVEFTRPLYTIFDKEFGIKVEVNEVIPENVKLGVITFYYDRTKVPVYHEAILAGSRFIVRLETDDNLKSANEKIVKIARARKFGYGKTRIIVD